jgi:NADH-quinone oxidoreductase subunit G
MNHVGTICTHCSNGCKTTLGVRDNHILRGNNRDRSGINGEFLCIKGRYAFDFVDHPDRLQSPLLKVNGEFQPVSWTRALMAVGAKFKEVKEANGKFAVIGSTHTSNEENFWLQKFAREVLNTNSIDHRRTGDIAALLDALSGRTNALATVEDLYTTKAALIIGSDLSQQHPLLANQLRANFRHHNAAVYSVTEGPVRERKIAKLMRIAEPARQLDEVEALRSELAANGELVILFGDTVKGDAVRRLVAFGDSLGIPVKYICLVDYSNSRGAFDMGLVPESAGTPGLTLPEILAAPDLDVLWVVGANPLANAQLASEGAFVVVQEMFLTETAKRADVIFPAACAYEKDGTVTNVTGEIQQLKRASKTMGAKPDLEIFGLIAKDMGIRDFLEAKPEAVLNEIRQHVHGYNVPLPTLLTGGAAQTYPVNGHVAASRPDLIQSARDTLFTSGSLGRYSQKLNSVMERDRVRLYDSGVTAP